MEVCGHHFVQGPHCEARARASTCHHMPCAEQPLTNHREKRPCLRAAKVLAPGGGPRTRCALGITGLRLGMYGPLKSAMGADTDPTALKKIAAGSASGAIATFITNPIELLKTRLQSNSAMAPLQVLQKIVRENGVIGLWKGTMPSAVSPPSAVHLHILCATPWTLPL